VIHAVGPVWSGGDSGEEVLLASAYRTSLTVAEEAGVTIIAFPSISTGAYGFPIERAARIAIQTVTAFLSQRPAITKVVFCCFAERDAKIDEAAMGAEQPVSGGKAR
jgi:O-acetyl-ADP-ribose deacetylase (regulator of RNase III)